MEEDQEQKHVCKLCNKSFPCGRSLGGHMRSHVITNSAETDEKLSRKKLSASVNNDGINTNTDAGFDAGTHPVYGLRENPKKTCRFADSSEDTLLHGKFCKDCGKGFLSWKALFGHMKCHSEREKASNSLEEENSWTNANQKLVMDSQSDNEAAAPNRRRRSRRRTRYMATAATSSTFSIANASSSFSEIEQEQEEVAMCLIMLSKDVGQWGGLNSVAESSDNDSVFLEAPSSFRTNRINDKNTVCNGVVKEVKLNKLKDEKFESGNLDSESFQFDGKRSEFRASGVSKNGSKMKKMEVSINGFLGNEKMKKSKHDDGLRGEVSEVELGKNCIKEAGTDQAQLGSNKHNSSKRKFSDSYDPELAVESSKKTAHDASDSEIGRSSHKRSKFECTTCNKVFHSYQALGGHRASHKKIKGCFASRIESSENSIETEVSPDQTTDSKLIKSCNNDNPVDHDLPSGYPEKPEMANKSKKSKGHECPICFKVFSSGQALGGHKRSHLVGTSETKTNQTVVTQKPVSEIRDLLDLNLPAPNEEDSNGHIGFKPWWAGSSHKHEPLVGLISN